MGNTWRTTLETLPAVITTDIASQSTQFIFNVALEYKEQRKITEYLYLLIVACNRGWDRAIIELYDNISHLSDIQWNKDISDMCDYYTHASYTHEDGPADPSTSYYYTILGYMSLYGLGGTHKDARYAESCFRRNTNVIDLLCLGYIYRSYGQRARAVEMYEHSYTLLKLPYTLYVIARMTDSSSLYTQVLNLCEEYPESLHTCFTLGCMYLYGNVLPVNVPVAIGYLAKIYTIHPHNVDNMRNTISKERF